MQEGLTPDEAEAAALAIAKFFPDAKVSTGTTKEGALVVVAAWTEPNGSVETLTLNRLRGRYALLNSIGQRIVEADELDQILGGAQQHGQ